MEINYEYLGRKIIGGGIDVENRRFLRFEEYYKLANVEDLPYFLAFLSPHGRIIHLYPCFRLMSSSVERITSPLPDGSATVTIMVNCSTDGDIVEKDVNGDDLNEFTPPWDYRPEHFRIESVSQEENASICWPAGNIGNPQVGIRIARPENRPLFMYNTAGMPLNIKSSRGLSRISFRYNIETIDPNFCWQYVSKINRDAVRIAGMDFPKRTVMIHNLTMEQVVERNNDLSVRWKYYQVNIVLMIDPQTYNRDYLNVGTHVKTSDGLAALWCWGNGRYFGTLQNYHQSVFNDGREVTSPLFLNTDGNGISAFSIDGKQLPVYLPASVYEPISFDDLCLPKER